MTKTQTWLQRGRISPRDVLEAYETSGLKPMSHSFKRVEGGEVFACALKAVAVELAGTPDASVFDMLPRHGLSDDYAIGFMDGFDGLHISCVESAHDERKGWRDGRRAARFCFGESV